jgi:inorganic pyrophosphatase
MAIVINKLPARESETGRLNVVVDTPKGSRNKYKYDEKAQVWRLSKMLPLGASFPFDFGFIPSTKGEDGDPVDVLVLNEEPAFAGCVLPAVLVGIIEAEQTEKGKTVRNDRLIAVIETPLNPPPVHSLEEIGEQRLAEIEHFFVAYNEMEGRTFKVLRRRGAKEAEAKLNAALID